LTTQTTGTAAGTAGRGTRPDPAAVGAAGAGAAAPGLPGPPGPARPAGRADGSPPGGPAGVGAGLLLAPLAVTLAGLRAALRRPSLLVAATVLLVCLPSGREDLSGGAHIGPADLASLALVAVAAVRMLAGERPLTRRGWVPFAAVLLALAAATITSADTAASLTGFVRYAQVFVLVPVAVLVAVQDRRDTLLIGGALLGTAVLQGSLGVWQYLTETGASYEGRNVRAVGTFGALDIMGMATVVGFGLVVALALGLSLRGRARVALLAVAAALTVPLMLSLSRGVWIATFCAVVVVLAAAGRRVLLRAGVAGLALGVVLVGGLGVGSDLVGERLGSITSATSAPDQSVNDRYTLWRAATGMWADHPVTGVGLKGFPAFRDGYAPMGLSAASDVDDPALGFQREPLLSPHNMYLLVLSEQGLAGLVAFCGLMLVLAGCALARRPDRFPARADRGPADRFLALAAPGIMTWILVDFGYADIGGPGTVLLSVMLGLVARRGLSARGGLSERAGLVTLAARPDQATARPAVPVAVPVALPVALPVAVPVAVPVAGQVRAAAPVTAPALPAQPPPAPPLPVPARGDRWPLGAPLPPAPVPLVPSPRTPGHGDTPAAEQRRREGRHLIVRAAALSAAFTVIGFVLGFGRDLLLATLFGANRDTDAFLVAWMIPETAAPLLIEDAMAFLLVPLFSRALAQGEDVRALVGVTLRRICAVLVAVAVAVAVTAPVLVRVLAPGLDEPGTAVTATRLVSVTVLMFGLAGYLSAALRSHQVFGPPASIYVAYNVGILTLMVLLHGRIGIMSAAVGVAAGSVLMVAVQLPAFVRRVGLPRPRAATAAAVSLGAFLPIAGFTLTRQAQVFVERFIGSSLEAGTISHLNYAQKVAQVPMILALVITTVTFPALARAIATGDGRQARRRIESDLRVVGVLVLLGTAFLVVFAPQMIALLFEHGRFTAADTAATAAIVRVYTLGLLGQAVVSVLCRAFFSVERPTWYPVVVMAGGLVATAAVAAVTVPWWGAGGIAAGNAAGITLTALVLLFGLRSRAVPVSPAAVGLTTLRLGTAAFGAGAAGWGTARLLDGSPAGLPPLATVVAGGLVMAAAFCALASVTARAEIRALQAQARGVDGSSR
jgi:putative peptidoglycan lipid II flippase